MESYEMTEAIEGLGKELHQGRLAFAIAGKAIFTIRSKKTGKHYTYKILEGRVRHFASVRHGDDFLDIGSFKKGDTQSWYWPNGSPSPSAKALTWFLRNPDSDQIEFFHMGKCAMCGRALTNPESIESGFGPICAGRL
ncbi:MAG: DUF6011 domain-containing protein [Desulfobulbia bacterium]